MAFSIKQLLFSMAVVAFGLVAMLSEDKPLLGKLFDLLTLGILIAMAYGAWLSTGECRAFRLGFLCWALLYFYLFKKIFNVGLSDMISRAFRGLLNLVWSASGGGQTMMLPGPSYSASEVSWIILPQFLRDVPFAVAAAHWCRRRLADCLLLPQAPADAHETIRLNYGL